MVSVPILAGALMRFPLGVVAPVHRPQERGDAGNGVDRRRALLYGFFVSDTYDE